jgi:hypothetical protein
MERVIAEDEAAWNITNWAEEHCVDLIVMGTHGYGKIRGLLMGSVIAKVMHEVSCPVWTDSLANLEDERWEPGITNIVCALELTAEAIPLLRFTLELAKELGAPSRVIHSVPEIESRPNKYFDFDLQPPFSLRYFNGPDTVNPDGSIEWIRKSGTGAWWPPAVYVVC